MVVLPKFSRPHFDKNSYFYTVFFRLDLKKNNYFFPVTKLVLNYNKQHGQKPFNWQQQSTVTFCDPTKTWDSTSEFEFPRRNLNFPDGSPISCKISTSDVTYCGLYSIDYRAIIS